MALANAAAGEENDFMGPSPSPAGGRRGYHARLGIAGVVCAWLLAVCCLIASGCPTDSVASYPRSELRSPWKLTLEVTDTTGTPIETRVRICASDGKVYPPPPNSIYPRYEGAGGFCYSFGTITVDIPAGSTHVTVGRGIEWNPYENSFLVESDTTFTIELDRFIDLRDEGWYGGELHAHSHHAPINYHTSPGTAMLLARAEGLSIVHLLDQWYEFTGEPHTVSDDETIIYYGWEDRNQAYGHVSFPGLRASTGGGCCLSPEPAYPMLTDLHRQFVPDSARMMVLAHPHSTDDYFYDEDWPGAGLGRELPILAALGGLDALEVASYSNDPVEAYQDWYDVLSAGLPCPLAAGTDGSYCNMTSPPVGGWRTYSYLGPAAPLDYDVWVDSLAAGRTFITNYPLIPEFDVDGFLPGDVIDVEGETFEAAIHLRTLCALGLQRLMIIAEGEEVWSADLGRDGPSPTEIDTSFAISISTPGWIAAKVEGIPGHPHAAIGDPVAHTNVIRITRGGEPTRRTAPSARLISSLDMLEIFVGYRNEWYEPWHADTVFNRIDRARDFYRTAFVIPPSPFHLLHPADGDTLHPDDLYFDWENAVDPEPGDRVTYTLSVYPDSNLTDPIVTYNWLDSSFGYIELDPQRSYWWNVAAIDRGENVTMSSPGASCFRLELPFNEAPEVDGDPILRPRAFPNPSCGPVTLEGFNSPLAIYDVSGRCVARSGDGISTSDGVPVWNGKICGRYAPPGLYWACSETDGSSIRLIRIR